MGCLSVVWTATGTMYRRLCRTFTVSDLSTSTSSQPTSSWPILTGVSWQTSAVRSACRQRTRHWRGLRACSGCQAVHHHVDLVHRRWTARLPTGRRNCSAVPLCRRRLMSTRSEWRCGSCAVVPRRRTPAATFTPSSSPSSLTTTDQTRLRRCVAAAQPTVERRPSSASTRQLGPRTDAIETSSAAAGMRVRPPVQLPLSLSDCSRRGGPNWTRFRRRRRSTLTTRTISNSLLHSHCVASSRSSRQTTEGHALKRLQPSWKLWTYDLFVL